MQVLLYILTPSLSSLPLLLAVCLDLSLPCKRYYILMLKKRPTRALYKVRLICIVIRGSLTGHAM